MPDRCASYFARETGEEATMKEIRIGRNARPICRGRHDLVSVGGACFDLPDELRARCWRDEKSGTTEVRGRLNLDRPPRAMGTGPSTPNEDRYLDPQWDRDDSLERVNRPITYQEAALTPGFLEDHLSQGAKIGITRQINESVPVSLSAMIARRVRKALENDR